MNIQAVFHCIIVIIMCNKTSSIIKTAHKIWVYIVYKTKKAYVQYVVGRVDRRFASIVHHHIRSQPECKHWTWRVKRCQHANVMAVHKVPHNNDQPDQRPTMFLSFFLCFSVLFDGTKYSLAFCIIFSWTNSMKINTTSPGFFFYYNNSGRSSTIGHVYSVSEFPSLFRFQVKNKQLFLFAEAPNWIMFMSCCTRRHRPCECGCVRAMHTGTWPMFILRHIYLGIRFVDFIWFVSKFNER